MKETSQKDGPVVTLNFDPPGTVLFDELHVETDAKMIQFACIFGLLSMLTIVIDKLINKVSSVCPRTNRFIWMCICASIICVANFTALYIALLLLTTNFNVYFITAIAVGRGIGWLITEMIANIFNKCFKKSSHSSSLFKEGGRRENGRENRQEQEEPIEMTAMTGTPRAKMVDEDLAGDDVDVYLEKKEKPKKFLMTPSNSRINRGGVGQSDFAPIPETPVKKQKTPRKAVKTPTKQKRTTQPKENKEKRFKPTISSQSPKFNFTRKNDAKPNFTAFGETVQFASALERRLAYSKELQAKKKAGLLDPVKYRKMGVKTSTKKKTALERRLSYSKKLEQRKKAAKQRKIKRQQEMCGETTDMQQPDDEAREVSDSVKPHLLEKTNHSGSASDNRDGDCNGDNP